MFSFLLVTILSVPFIQAEEDEMLAPNNKTRCINELMQWCDGMQYSQEGSGITIVSLSYRDDTSHVRVLCSSDSNGTSCTKNEFPWFVCTPDHILTYKGQVMSDTATDVDDDICKAVDIALNELLLQNTTLTRLRNELGSFFSEFTAMWKEFQDFWDGFGGFFLRGRDPDTRVPDDDDNSQSNSKDSNQIERE